MDSPKKTDINVHETFMNSSTLGRQKILIIEDIDLSNNNEKGKEDATLELPSRRGNET